MAELEPYDSRPGDVEPEIVEGEIVDEDQQPPARRRPVHVITAAAKHEHSRRIARHCAYVAAGAGVLVRRVWDSRTTARHDRGFRAAERSGDAELMLKWEHQRHDFLKERHRRRTDLLEVPFRTLLLVPKAAYGAAIALGIFSVFLAVGTRNARNLATPAETIAAAVRITVEILSAALLPAAALAGLGVLCACWSTGRRHARLPGWVATTASADVDVSIDETTLARALAALRIPQIRDYLAEGLPLQYVTPCRQEGRGTYAAIRLPAVPAEKVARRRADFAAGVHRLAKEVWLSTGSEAAILEAWIADKGALDEGAGPYPLLDEGFTDVFRGVPFGRTLRGDPVKAPLMGRNTIVGGMPEQGKSSAARVIMCGAALDVTAELRIYIPDVNYDFEVMKPRCSRYIMGAEDEHIEAILRELEELKDEIQDRGQLLVDHQVPEVTRQLASAGVGLHPLFVLLEEAHIAIQHPKYGKRISGLLCDIVKLGRKRAIHMIVSTQAPMKDSMPRDVTRNCSNGIAFAVGDHGANDALLGQGAYRAGHRATDLIPGTDRGTALVKGFSGQRSETVQVYFLSVARDNDEVTQLVRRALAEIARLGRQVPAGDRPAIEARDLLEDLGEVLGPDPVRLADLPARLRKLAPGWVPYRPLTGVQLRELLAAEGVRVVTKANVPRLNPADLRAALAGRPADDEDEE